MPTSEALTPTRPVVVAIPGLGLDDRAWAPTLRRLDGAERRVVALLPGFGLPAESGAALRDAHLSPASLAQLLVDRLDSGSYVLLGHSASCQIVVHAAALAPHLVVGVVLVGPTTDPRAARWPRMLGRWARTAIREPPWQVPLLLAQYWRTGLRSALPAMHRALKDPVMEVAARVFCPVLIVRGHLDRIAPADWLQNLGTATHGAATVVTLRTGAHMVPLTRGPALAPVIARWLDAQAARSS